ncbi:MAG: S46 family peptidase [Candidatus Eremiobacteraeota bacterium]|nr:S46 family peptidase [Candidatus Eremiobacteraeota bacterium]
MKNLVLSLLIAAVLVTAVQPFATSAEEGMWTFDSLPRGALKKAYGFEPSGEWTDHARLSSVRFKGGSGSFISATGLVLTNHHVVRADIQKISTPEHDYVKNGFHAPTPDRELPCPDVELRVLAGLEEVTDRLVKASRGLGPEEAQAARKKEIAAMEHEHFQKTGCKGEVVALYHGGEYWLYSYRTYKDVRLVFSPENQVAHFGDRYDNFTYPRYALDFAIFRVYDQGRPAAVQHFFTVNAGGVTDGELIFTIGHPGTTSRQLTVSQVLFLKDAYYPVALAHLRRSLKVLEEYSRRGPEERRQAFAQKYSIENSLKRAEGEYAGITAAGTVPSFREGENALREALERKPELLKATGDPWGEVARITTRYRERFNALYYLFRENRLLSQALQLVLLAEEREKPDGERLAAYRTSRLDSLRDELLSQAPVYRDMEQAQLADYLAEVREHMGPDNPYVSALLSGKATAERAAELMAGTALDRAETRKALFEGGAAAVAESGDTLIALARRLAPLRREMMKWSEEQYSGPLERQHELIARARFALYGKTVYPDGTGTLRLAYGTVKGYPYNGTLAPPFTTFFGMYDRYFSFLGCGSEWSLPQPFLDRREALKLPAQLNFISTCDTTGGNSGSAVINRKGEIVGLNFDGNMEGLSGRYIYDFGTKRAIAVSMAAIVEVLRSVYGAGKLADELTGR